MSASSFWSGNVPASEFLVALTITTTRMAFSFGFRPRRLLAHFEPAAFTPTTIGVPPDRHLRSIILERLDVQPEST
jgi:hypothetical protein